MKGDPMATVRGWARRLNAAESWRVDFLTGICYDRKIPETLSLTLNRTVPTIKGGEEDVIVQKLEVRFTPDEARRLGDSIVEFLTQLEA
jgi:hypothetical protein